MTALWWIRRDLRLTAHHRQRALAKSLRVDV